MLPYGSKHSSFSAANNFNGTKLLFRKIISTLIDFQPQYVVIGLKATSLFTWIILSVLSDKNRNLPNSIQLSTFLILKLFKILLCFTYLTFHRRTFHFTFKAFCPVCIYIYIYMHTPLHFYYTIS